MKTTLCELGNESMSPRSTISRSDLDPREEEIKKKKSKSVVLPHSMKKNLWRRNKVENQNEEGINGVTTETAPAIKTVSELAKANLDLMSTPSEAETANDCPSDEETVRPEQKLTKQKSRSLWKAAVDDHTGQTYYYNRETRATQWSKPSGFVDRDTKKEQRGDKEENRSAVHTQKDFGVTGNKTDKQDITHDDALPEHSNSIKTRRTREVQEEEMLTFSAIQKDMMSIIADSKESLARVYPKRETETVSETKPGEPGKPSSQEENEGFPAIEVLPGSSNANEKRKKSWRSLRRPSGGDYSDRSIRDTIVNDTYCEDISGQEEASSEGEEVTVGQFLRGVPRESEDTDANREMSSAKPNLWKQKSSKSIKKMSKLFGKKSEDKATKPEDPVADDMNKLSTPLKKLQLRRKSKKSSPAPPVSNEEKPDTVADVNVEVDFERVSSDSSGEERKGRNLFPSPRSLRKKLSKREHSLEKPKTENDASDRDHVASLQGEDVPAVEEPIPAAEARVEQTPLSNKNRIRQEKKAVPQDNPSVGSPTSTATVGTEDETLTDFLRDLTGIAQELSGIGYSSSTDSGDSCDDEDDTITGGTITSGSTMSDSLRRSRHPPRESNGGLAWSTLRDLLICSEPVAAEVLPQPSRSPSQREQDANATMEEQRQRLISDTRNGVNVSHHAGNANPNQQPDSGGNLQRDIMASLSTTGTVDSDVDTTIDELIEELAANIEERESQAEDMEYSMKFVSLNSYYSAKPMPQEDDSQYMYFDIHADATCLSDEKEQEQQDVTNPEDDCLSDEREAQQEDEEYLSDEREEAAVKKLLPPPKAYPVDEKGKKAVGPDDERSYYSLEHW